MITKKVWNSFTNETRVEIIKKVLGATETTYIEGLQLPYKHDFDYDTYGKVLRHILECLYKVEGGDIKVCTLITPKYSSPTTSSPSIKRSSRAKDTSSVATKYICYFEKRDETGELIDDFSEWCTASSAEEAVWNFKNEYALDPRVSIVSVYPYNS